jgi:hypothetical protein
MSQPDYRKRPEEVDMAQEERAIRLHSTVALLIVVATGTVARLVLPGMLELPAEPADRLAFAALCWAVTGFVLLVAIMMVSTGRRRSAADIGGQAAGPPSQELAIKSAFLQNTLEQAVLAGGFYFALAALADGAWLAVLPVAVAFFVIGRVLFYLGYRSGAKGRALGMALTMLPSALGYFLVAFLYLFGG